MMISGNMQALRFVGYAEQSAAELAAFFGHRAVIVEKNKPGGATR